MVALMPRTLRRCEAGQLIDALHELNHARHSTLFSRSTFDLLASDPVQLPRMEICEAVPSGSLSGISGISILES